MYTPIFQDKTDFVSCVATFFYRTVANHRATKKTLAEMELLVFFCAIDTSSTNE